MNTPCHKCLCTKCASNPFVPQQYWSDSVTECLICIGCKDLQAKAKFCGDALAVETCTAFVRKYEQGGADNDGAHVQQNAATRDA